MPPPAGYEPPAGMKVVEYPGGGWSLVGDPSAAQHPQSDPNPKPTTPPKKGMKWQQNKDGSWSMVGDNSLTGGQEPITDPQTGDARDGSGVSTGIDEGYREPEPAGGAFDVIGNTTAPPPPAAVAPAAPELSIWQQQKNRQAEVRRQREALTSEPEPAPVMQEAEPFAFQPLTTSQSSEMLPTNFGGNMPPLNFGVGGRNIFEGATLRDLADPKKNRWAQGNQFTAGFGPFSGPPEFDPNFGQRSGFTY